MLRLFFHLLICFQEAQNPILYNGPLGFQFICVAVCERGGQQVHAKGKQPPISDISQAELLLPSSYKIQLTCMYTNM